jgi:imidazolonepropionase-like amidohydrolase
LSGVSADARERVIARQAVETGEIEAATLDGAPARHEGRFALVGARLLDGGRGPGRDNVMLLVRDGVVAEVREGADPPRDYGILDVAGRTVMPGLIDAHVHLSSLSLPAPPRGELAYETDVRPYAQAAASRAMLDGGITTARDVGSHGRELFVLRRAIGAGLCDGPRLLLCGQIVSPTSPGGRLFSSMYREADGPDEMRKAVREQIRQGADLIKVMTTGALTVPRESVEPAQMTADELDVIVEESHRQGFRVASHAEGLPGIRLSVDGGVDTVEHGEQLHRAPDLLARMAERGIVLVPTLSVFETVAEVQSCCFTHALVEQAKRLRDDAYRTVAAARAAGVAIVMGFDSGPHGANAVELVRLADAGLTAAEAVVAGTSGAAAACALADVGRVAPGQQADLLVVDGDPLVDVRVLADDARRWLVLLAGRPVAGRALARELPSLEVLRG